MNQRILALLVMAVVSPAAGGLVGPGSGSRGESHGCMRGVGQTDSNATYRVYFCASSLPSRSAVARAPEGSSWALILAFAAHRSSPAATAATCHR